MYFAGRLVGPVDRLGSVSQGTENLRFYPYGEEEGNTTQDRDKWATYYRDTTNLDYARNRYYSSQIGRFLTPDPSQPGNPAVPQSWNYYGYTQGDPINFNDPKGLNIALVVDGITIGEFSYGGSGGAGGYISGTETYSGNENGDPFTRERPFTIVLPDDPFGGTPNEVSGSEPWYDRHPCDKRDPTNARILTYISQYRADAEAIAPLAGIDFAFVLAVAAEETLYGTAGIVLNSNNFFGLHVNSSDDTHHFENQTGVLYGDQRWARREVRSKYRVFWIPGKGLLRFRKATSLALRRPLSLRGSCTIMDTAYRT